MTRVRLQVEFPGDIAGPFVDRMVRLKDLPMVDIAGWLALGWKVTLTQGGKHE